ncbi:hypothetical protein GCM10008938_00120 [Deinococcus roseus]|uniref:Uncharacterized protein n=1 Tax=Deinococcus roseus TaxID=392414 RepID=A0ABQ2CUL0_9DEIO|nr:hypothetical protein GCM10008938_00120 [Deinococcus roseus]
MRVRVSALKAGMCCFMVFLLCPPELFRRVARDLEVEGKELQISLLFRGYKVAVEHPLNEA